MLRRKEAGKQASERGLRPITQWATRQPRNLRCNSKDPDHKTPGNFLNEGGSIRCSSGSGGCFCLPLLLLRPILQREKGTVSGESSFFFPANFISPSDAANRAKRRKEETQENGLRQKSNGPVEPARGSSGRAGKARQSSARKASKQARHCMSGRQCVHHPHGEKRAQQMEPCQ